MQLLMNDTAVMSCHEGYWDARYRGDSGAALALLQAGYNLDTLMLRYQGIDWRHNKEWGCNARWAAGADSGAGVGLGGERAGVCGVVWCAEPR